MDFNKKLIPDIKYIGEKTKEAGEKVLGLSQHCVSAAKAHYKHIVMDSGDTALQLSRRCVNVVKVHYKRSVMFSGEAAEKVGKMVILIRKNALRLCSWRRAGHPNASDFSHGIICVKSFFGGYFSSVHKKRRKWALASASLCAALMLSVTVINSQFCIGMYIDGEEIGKAETISDVATIVTSAEEQIAEILGHDYSVSKSLSLAPNVKNAAPAAEEIEKAIITSVDGVDEKYTLVVGGEVVGAADEEKVLESILDGVLEEYKSEATDSVRFIDEVEVVKQYVTENVVQDPEVIKTLIQPANDESEYSLVVENVESTLISEEIPFVTEYVEDESLFEGESVVVAEGSSGVALVTEKLVLLNGVEQSREKVGLVVTKTPVPEVIAVGTTPRPPTMSYGTYIWPAEGILTSGFGGRSTSVGSSNHMGIDIAGRSGQSIYAADGGEVIYAGWMKAYGNMVQIRHDNGDETVYGHNSKLLVSVGERVMQGQEIALMGSTGLSSGVHCHFEIRINGVPVNPQKFLS